MKFFLSRYKKARVRKQKRTWVGCPWGLAQVVKGAYDI